jgi:hypothetical protein
MLDEQLVDGMAGCDVLMHAAPDTFHGAGLQTQRHIMYLLRRAPLAS